MDRYDEILKKLYAQRNLDNEDWINPSDDIYSKIESRLDDKNSPRSAAPWLLVIFFALISFLACFTGYHLITKTEVKNNLDLTQVETLADPSVVPSLPQTIIENPNTDQSKTQIQKFTDNAHDDSSEINRRTESVALNESILIPTRSASLNPQLISNSTQKDTYNTITAENTHPSNTRSEIFEDSNNQDLTKENKPEKLSVLSIAKLPLDEFQLEKSEPKFKFIDPVSKLESSGFSIQPFISYVHWSVQLNDHYQNHLTGADFIEENGKGVALGIELSYDLSRRFSIGIETAYADIGSQSGHNAKLNFATEDDKNQSFENQTLATPYGTVQSNFVINRNTGMAESIDLDASIHSSHKISIAKLEPFIQFELLDNNYWNLSIGAGVGYNHIIDLENDLSYINTHHDNYGFEDGHIFNDQQGLTSGFWNLSARTTIAYQLSGNQSIGVGAKLSEGISALFRENDFSSTPRIAQLSLSYKYSFQ